MPATLQIVYASTTGHTEFVVTVLRDFLAASESSLRVTLQSANQVQPESAFLGDIVILACGTWNTGSVEGQLHPAMHRLLTEQASAVDLKGKPMAVIGAGDTRYRYRAKAADRLEAFITSHGGRLIIPTLRIINDPYEQEEAVRAWGTTLLTALKTL